jgi:hypothetical protein
MKRKDIGKLRLNAASLPRMIVEYDKRGRVEDAERCRQILLETRRKIAEHEKATNGS